MIVVLLMALLPMLCRSVFYEDFQGAKNLDKVWSYPSDSKYARFSPSSIFKEARKKRETNVELKATKKNEYYGVTAMLEEPVNLSKGEPITHYFLILYT